MNELDILKKHWKEAKNKMPHYSYTELYKMLHKKSSSIVKWILIISLIEFLIWGLLYFVIPEGSRDIFDKMNLENVMLASTILSLCIFVLFIYLFYSNYTKIKVTDSVKQLMRSILRTRRTVYLFIIWNIANTLVGFVIVFFFLRSNKEKLIEYIAEQNPAITIENSEYTIRFFFFGYVFSAVVMIGLMFLLYRIVYVRLLKRLKNNYKQLQEIEND